MKYRLFLLSLLLTTACDDVQIAQFESPEIITQGSQIYGANGIAIDPQQNLRIASVFGGQIVVMDPNNGQILDRIGAERNVFGPDDLAFGSDGSMYVTNIITGDITKVEASGTSTIVANVGPGANPITLDNNDRLLVGQCFLGNGLFEVDPNGINPVRTIIESLGGPCGLNGFDIGPDGALYAPRFFEPHVLRIDIETGTREIIASGFIIPNGVKFDSLGRMTVLDAGAGTISRFELDNNGLPIGNPEIIATELFGFDSHAIDADGKIYATSIYEGQVWEVGKNGLIRPLNRGGMTLPGGLVVRTSTSHADEIIIADSDVIRVIDSQTGLLKESILSIIGQPGLNGSMTIAPYSNTPDVFVLTSLQDNSVKIWNYQSREITTTRHDIALPVNAIEFTLNNIRGIAVSSLQEGVVWIDPNDISKRVVLVTNVIASGLLQDQEGQLWVADRPSGRLLVVANNSGVLDTPQTMASNLQGPEGLTFGPDGRILVVEADASRLISIAPDDEDGEIEIIAEELSLGRAPLRGFSPLGLFNDVAVSPSGDVYLTGDINNVLYRLKKL